MRVINARKRFTFQAEAVPQRSAVCNVYLIPIIPSVIGTCTGTGIDIRIGTGIGIT